ncbi:hypothetical protein ATANTOWER_014811 [Ataeniobius toweri]|uniref:Uncharacterized protein n=1 Tax=Ataeniobius toweri TaxID=208326 RepID=A0ABU7A6E6_9TELE|nr:hypothetical protein [Ataeniobius toweri]
MGGRQGTLDRSTVHHRATQTHTGQTTMHTGSRSTRRETTHANSMQKDAPARSQTQDLLDQGNSATNCATMQTKNCNMFYDIVLLFLAQHIFIPKNTFEKNPYGESLW